MIDAVIDIAWESWLVFGQMAPYLLFGFLVAGVLSVWLSPEWIERHLSGRGSGPIFKASLFGIPLPLCSCGVIPVSASLRQHGASRAAVTSFLLSTPQTGVDSIAVTYALLGPVFAIVRPIAALLTGLFGGALVQVLDESNGDLSTSAEKNESCRDSCCTAKPNQKVWPRILQYGFVTLPRDLAGAMLIGIAVAGTMTALIPPDYLSAYIGGGIVSILIMMAAGVPIYVCATASVPIAEGFMHAGASPGAALAFLIAGPATNAAAFATIWKVLGKRTAVLYIFSVAASAIVFGLLLNGITPAASAAVPGWGAHHHGMEESGGVLSHAWAVALLAVLLYSYWSANQTDGTKTGEDGSNTDDTLEKLVLPVAGMTCNHCASSVTIALTECQGVRSVAVDLKKGSVTVTGNGLEQDQLESAVTSVGFTIKNPSLT